MLVAETHPRAQRPLARTRLGMVPDSAVGALAGGKMLQVLLLACQIDGREAGNLGTRFHGAHPPGDANLAAVPGLAAGLPRVDFVARRAIAAGDRLAWDYGAAYCHGLGRAPQPLLRGS